MLASIIGTVVAIKLNEDSIDTVDSSETTSGFYFPVIDETGKMTGNTFNLRMHQ